MPLVTVGVLRNNIWSLRFNENVHILFPTVDAIQWDLLKTEYTAFDSTTIFHIGLLTMEKGPEPNEWRLYFPGVFLDSDKLLGLVCKDGLSQEIVLRCEQMRDLLEFTIHMRNYGQLVDN
jgi:hypothetical protein